MQYIRLLDDHEKMIRLAQALLQQTGKDQGATKSEVVDGAKPAEKPTPAPKPAKLH